MNDRDTTDVKPPVLGGGEAGGGYREWCEARDRQAPFRYSLRGHSGLLFSVIVPVHNPPEKWLQECIDSVRSQFFADWELILSDDASAQATSDVLRKNQALDQRIKISFHPSQSGISAVTNRGAELASGDFLVFLDHDDILDFYALSAFAQRLQSKPDTDILYADEDRFDDQYRRLHPGFKPQYSPEKLLCTNYIHHPVVMRRTLFEELGGFNSQYDGSQDYDLLLRATEVTTKIEHIPDVLYHMRLHSGSLSSGPEAKPEAHKKGRAALRDHLRRQNVSAIVKPTEFPGYHNLTYPIVHRPKTSILLLADADTPQETVQPFWQQNPKDEILICTDDKTTVPRRFNALSRKAQGDILIFADGRLQPEPDCIDELLGHCVRKNIGLVTGKLAYNDGKLHSCGLTLGTRGCAGRWHYACGADDLGYGGWTGINHEVSAVPWQLMAVKREMFIQAGLFDVGYVKHGFDVHLALELSSTQAVRHLSVARAKSVYPYPCPQQPETWLEQDFIRLWTHWKKILNRTDPFYHPYFSIYDESISFMNENEQYLKRFGVFNAYDQLSARLLWQCFISV